MNKKSVIAVVLLVIALLTGLRLWSSENTDAGAMTLYGNVEIREVDMAFRSSGRIARMLFDEGDSVIAGQVLAELDSQPYEDALSGAEAEVQRAEAELAKLQAGNRVQEVERAGLEVQAALALLERTEADWQRQTQLHAEQIASARTLEAARAIRDEAQARVAVLRQVESLQQEGARGEDITAAQARLAVAQAQRAQASTALADTRLLAPTDALVATRVREVGSMVNSSQTVYQLSLTDPIYIRAYVGELALAEAVPGREIIIRSDSIEHTYRGQVGFVSPRAEFTPKAVESEDLRTDLVYRLRVVVQDADERLRQGMPVTLEFVAADTAVR
jgi:HlyD family secretion protein